MSRKTEFQDLPIELRSNVWRLLLPLKGQVLRLKFHKVTESSEYASALGSATNPVILYINQESRTFAKSHLQLGFGYWSKKSEGLWWNPSETILYLPHWISPHEHRRWQPSGISESAVQGTLEDASGIGTFPKLHTIPAVQHLALPYSHKVLSGLGFNAGNSSWSLVDHLPLRVWLYHLPYLRTLTLVLDFDPDRPLRHDVFLQGMDSEPFIATHQPSRFLFLKAPTEVENIIQKKMEELWVMTRELWDGQRSERAASVVKVRMTSDHVPEGVPESLLHVSPWADL